MLLKLLHEFAQFIFNQYISCIAVLTWKLANHLVETRSMGEYITDNIFTKPVKDQYTT